MIFEILICIILIGFFALIFSAGLKFVDFMSDRHPALQSWIDSFTYEDEESEV